MEMDLGNRLRATAALRLLLLLVSVGFFSTVIAEYSI